MLAYQVIHNTNELLTPEGFVQLMHAHPALRDEVLEIGDFLQDETNVSWQPLPSAPVAWPLALHARYERREIQAAIGHITATTRPQFREGCLPRLADKIELMFVTLDKREGFGETVQFHDYAISPELFHWQTQNRAGPNNATGQRYLESKTNGWQFQLFVREDTGNAFIALGPVVLESFAGDRPISIVWHLQIPMPIEMFRRFSVLRDS